MLLADENVSYPVVRKLRELGVDVFAVVDSDYRGISDEKLIRLANSKNWIILTKDRDFTQRALLKRSKTGVIFISVPITKENYIKIAENINMVVNKAYNKLTLIYEDSIERYAIE